MKLISKSLFITALAACTAFVSCGGGSDDPEIKDGKFVDMAAKYDLVDPVPLASTELKSIEFTTDGRALLVEEADKESVRISEFTFTKAGNGTYSINGFGTVKVNGTSLTITPAGSSTVTRSSNVTVTGSGVRTADKQFFHTWKVSRSIIVVKGGNVNIGGGKTFNGLNAKEIADYIASQGVTIPDMDIISGYTVKTITLSPAGTIAIEFTTPANNYLGSFNLSGKSFSYTMSIGQGNSFINVNASGTAEIKKGKCEIVINGTFTAGGTTYTTNVELTLQPA